MKVIKKINNNVALCLDASGQELVAMGKGIGFPPVPYELNDLRSIEQTFYNVDPSFLDLFTSIPQEYFDLTSQILNYAKRKIPAELNPNLLFTLTDHIAFAVQRKKQRIKVQMPLQYEVSQRYPLELEIGRKAVAFIQRRLHIRLDESEAVGIALHLINGQVQIQDETFSDDELIEAISILIENETGTMLDRSGFSYARFVTHLQYLLQRQQNGQQFETENMQMYAPLAGQYPASAALAEQISELIGSIRSQTLNKEEQVYLMVHLTRLISRENTRL